MACFYFPYNNIVESSLPDVPHDVIRALLDAEIRLLTVDASTEAAEQIWLRISKASQL